MEVEFNDRRFSGEVDTAPVRAFEPEYWRRKASEFQATMNAVDAIAQESWTVMSVLPDGPERDAIARGMEEFEAKKGAMKMAAEGINFGASLLNAAGGRFPVLSVPASLGLPAFVMPAAGAAALVVAANLIDWGRLWGSSQTANLRAALQAAEAIADPQVRDETKAEIARALARGEAARAQMETPLASLVSLAKWGGIAVLAFLAWRHFGGSRGSSAA